MICQVELASKADQQIKRMGFSKDLDPAATFLQWQMDKKKKQTERGAKWALRELCTCFAALSRVFSAAPGEYSLDSTLNQAVPFDGCRWQGPLAQAVPSQFPAESGHSAVDLALRKLTLAEGFVRNVLDL